MMNKVVSISQNTGLQEFTGAQLNLMRHTVAKDCNNAEFDLFINMARSYALNPFRREIYAIVTNKDKQDKRQLVVVTGIDGYRNIASRQGDYAPDDDEPQFTYDEALKDPATNPLGIEKVVVRCFKGDRKVIGVAYWDEFAPLKEIWENQQPTGRFVLDSKKKNWRTMARLMLAKCAEAQALRKGWPNAFSGLYEESELDQATIDLSPSEWAEKEATDERIKKIGGKDTVALIWKLGDPIESVPIGQIADRVMGHMRELNSLAEFDWWKSTNRTGLQEFWAKAPNDALELKKQLEDRATALAKEEQEAG